MSSTSIATELARLIQQLQAERRQYEQAIVEIDATFARYGIAPGSALARRGPGRPKGSPGATTAPKRRKRKKYAETADQSILSLLKGNRKLTTGEINAAWKQAGRGGTADVTLMQMVKAGTLRREKVEGVKGSKYSKA